MRKQTIISVLLLLSLVGCDDKKEGSTLEVEKNITEKIEIKKVDATKEKDLLEDLGFDFKDDKIIIDINKTTNFFTQLEAKISTKAKEIESKIDNADINITEGMGIKVEGNQVGVDLNKTQNMLQQINVLMKDIFLDINNSKN